MSAKEDRPEFCQRQQDYFEEFARRHYEKLRLRQPARLPQYPAERLFDLTPSVAGWRIAMHVGDGEIGRAFPGIRFLTTARVPGIEWDFRTWPLRRTQVAACNHDCRPIPHPRCGCGVYASETAGDAARILTLGRDHWPDHRPDLIASPIAYPVILRQAFRRRTPTSPVHEVVGAAAELTGPILTASIAAAEDLRSHGFATQHVANTREQLAAHLEAMAVTA